MLELTSPTLLISEKIVRANLQRMADRARRHRLALRPHFKTHQSAEVSKWMRDYGIEEVTVTSLRMAVAAATAGWQRITIAMPCNPRELTAIASLAATTDLTVFLTDTVTATALAQTVTEPLSFFLEIDAGYGRSGISATAIDYSRAVIRAAGQHRFRGFYVHSGHTYHTDSVSEITQIHQRLLATVAEMRTAFSAYREVEFAIGDTPSCSTQEDFRGITSIGPGNFVYYDLVQASLGACTIEDIGICLAAPILQLIPERGEAVVHGGWVQLGKDRLATGSFGQVVRLRDSGEWELLPEESNSAVAAQVIGLSQEHGIIRLPQPLLTAWKVGDFVGILPVHACAAVNGMRTNEKIAYLPPA